VLLLDARSVFRIYNLGGVNHGERLRSREGPCCAGYNFNDFVALLALFPYVRLNLLVSKDIGDLVCRLMFARFGGCTLVWLPFK